MTVTQADLPPTQPTSSPKLISSSGPAPVRRGTPLWVTAALAVALVAALVAAGLLWHADRGHKDDAARAQALTTAGQQAKAAAQEVAVDMTSYSWQTVDQDFSWIDTAGTAHFQETYTRVSEPAKRLVKALHVTAVGSVMASGVDVLDPTHVNVVLFVDQRINGRGAGTSEPDRSRLVMHMVEQDGRWLVDSVELVGPGNNG